jgi:hypothetical protein
MESSGPKNKPFQHWGKPLDGACRLRRSEDVTYLGLDTGSGLAVSTSVILAINVCRSWLTFADEMDVSEEGEISFRQGELAISMAK